MKTTCYGCLPSPISKFFLKNVVFILTELTANMFRRATQCSFNLYRSYSSKVNPHTRTWNILSNDLKTLFGFKKPSVTYPEHADIVIIGGGFIGATVAYWLKTRAGDGLSVVVIEKDTSYSKNQKNVGLGVLGQHYSLPENIQLSQYAAEFLRNSPQYLGKSVDIKYTPSNHLYLASESYASKLEENVIALKDQGTRYNLLSKDELKSRYPWINTDDISLGCIGTELEGTFNSWEYLKGILKKSKELGTIYVNAEVIGFEFEKKGDTLMEGVSPGLYEKLVDVKYRTQEDEEYSVKFSSCVLAAGHESKSLAEKARIGMREGLLSVPLPISKRKYNVYSIENGGKMIGLDAPYIVDTSGLWFYRNGLESNILFGQLPFESDDVKDLSEEEYYKAVIEPSLYNRFPSCQNLKISKLHEEYIDHNNYDKTGIIGAHPYHTNMYFATGFGKDGCQHAIGLGRAVAELILDSNEYKTIDLTRYTFDRIFTTRPIIETNMY